VTVRQKVAKNYLQRSNMKMLCCFFFTAMHRTFFSVASGIVNDRRMQLSNRLWCMCCSNLNRVLRQIVIPSTSFSLARIFYKRQLVYISKY